MSTKQTIKSHVKNVVGVQVVDFVSQMDKDVLLEVYTPTCGYCKKLRSTYDIVGRAVAADERIVVGSFSDSS